MDLNKDSSHFDFGKFPFQQVKIDAFKVRKTKRGVVDVIVSLVFDGNEAEDWVTILEHYHTLGLADCCTYADEWKPVSEASGVYSTLGPIRSEMVGVFLNEAVYKNIDLIATLVEEL